MGLSNLLKDPSMTSISTGRILGSGGSPDDWDKRADKGSSIGAISDAIMNGAELISNAMGSRNPMYMIGDVTEDLLGGYSDYLPDAVKGLSRAVSNIVGGTKQQGVIIDGIGDVVADISVELPQNPILHRTDYITDQRVRNPNTVKMRVFVSNYLSDDILDAALSALESLDPTGLAKNLLSDGGNTRGQQALYKLRNIQERGIPFTLYTPHGIYENMLIKSITPSTRDNNVDMLDAEIKFVELLMYAPLGDVDNVLTRKNIQQAEDGTIAGATEGLYNKITGWF